MKREDSMDYYARKAQKHREMMPYMYALAVIVMLIILMARCEPEPLISAEKSYNDQRYANQLKDQQEAAIAKSLRRVAKEKSQKFLSAEDEAIEGFWPGHGRTPMSDETAFVCLVAISAAAVCFIMSIIYGRKR